MDDPQKYGRLSEKEIFARVAEGDEEAFNLVYQHFMSLMAGALLKLVKSEADVAEVLQEAFIRVWLNRDNIPVLDNPGAWVRRILVNESYRLIKKNNLRASLNTEFSALTTTNSTSDQHAAQLATLNETRNAIQSAIAELSPRQYTIYKLSREQGKRIPEIAAMLDLSPDYVKKTLATALEKMRKKLIAAGKRLPSVLF